MATRGRPKGTRKREHAEAAAADIRALKYDDVRVAALAHYQAHIGSKVPPPSLGEAIQHERFRDFVTYVIEALRSSMTLREWRTLKPVFDKRNVHPRIQQRRRNSVRDELRKSYREQMREAIGLPSIFDRP